MWNILVFVFSIHILNLYSWFFICIFNCICIDFLYLLGEKGSSLPVLLRLALLAMRRKLISEGSHQCWGGGSEITNFFFSKFSRKAIQKLNEHEKDVSTKFSEGFQLLIHGNEKWFRTADCGGDKKTGNWILKKNRDKKWSKFNFFVKVQNKKILSIVQFNVVKLVLS